MGEQPTVLLTGATGGIGRATALGLVRRGATVVLGCRDVERGRELQKTIIAATGSQRVHVLGLDLASQAAVRAAAAEYLQRFERLDVLINNGATFDQRLKQPTFTAEGRETVWATNHLGAFLLTNVLLDCLKASAPARIINIASKGLLSFPRLKINLEDPSLGKKYSPVRAYYHSKLAQVMWTLALARRLKGSGVTANVIRVPAVELDPERLAGAPFILRRMYAIKRRFSLSQERMAATYVALALADTFSNVSGAYIDEDLQRVKPSRYARKRKAQERLWALSEEQTAPETALAVGAAPAGTARAPEAEADTETASV